MTITRHATPLRLLWRMQGPARVVAAALYEHPAGRELRVYFEPDGMDDVLQTEVVGHDVAPLEEQAEVLRGLLRAQGWWPLPLKSQ
jgi:hypothetical protein